MDWSKITQGMVNAPEYIGSSPSERGTWLSVLMYCALMENGGRLRGANQWKDRQWQQTCGATLSEVTETTKLLTWDGDDLIVWNYPTEAEAEVKAKREAGSRGGRARVANASRSASMTDSSSASSIASTDKIRLDKSIEEKTVGHAAKPLAPVATSNSCDGEWLNGVANDETYRGIDVRQEHGKMLNWCRERKKLPSRRRFINWLNRVERPMTTTATPTSRPPVAAKKLWQVEAEEMVQGWRNGHATRETIIACRDAILAGGREAVNWLNSTLGQDERASLIQAWNVDHRWEPLR